MAISLVSRLLLNHEPKQIVQKRRGRQPDLLNFGCAVLLELLGVFVVWIQKKSFSEVSHSACVFPTAVAHHSPSHPSFLESRVQRNSPACIIQFAVGTRPLADIVVARRPWPGIDNLEKLKEIPDDPTGHLVQSSSACSNRSSWCAVAALLLYTLAFVPSSAKDHV